MTDLMPKDNKKFFGYFNLHIDSIPGYNREKNQVLCHSSGSGEAPYGGLVWVNLVDCSPSEQK